MSSNNQNKKKFIDPYIKLKKSFICPKCGSNEYIPLVYGRGLSKEDTEKSKKGEIIWMGDHGFGKRRCCKKCKTLY